MADAVGVMSAQDGQRTGAWRAIATWIIRLFDPRGRCDRKGLALVALVLLPLQLAFAVLVLGLELAWDHPFALAGKVVFLWIAIAAVVNRLHDLGRGAIWFLYATLIYLAWSVAVAVLAIALFGPEGIATGGAGFYFVLCANCAAMIAALLYVHFKRGEVGANRFGPAPGPDGFSHGVVHRDAAGLPSGPASAVASRSVHA